MKRTKEIINKIVDSVLLYSIFVVPAIVIATILYCLCKATGLTWFVFSGFTTLCTMIWYVTPVQLNTTFKKKGG